MSPPVEDVKETTSLVVSLASELKNLSMELEKRLSEMKQAKA